MSWGEIVAGAIEGLAGLGFKAYDNYQENQWNAAQEEIAKQQLALAEKDYYSNLDIMNRNFGLQQQAFDYNKQQAELTRMREDNAFQRRVADTMAAGFSPLATEGVASSSQSPTLTAPQLDPQGVNQATANRLSAYNSKLQQNNTTQQLRLQNQQLRLAQIETITETIQAVQGLRSQNIINQRNLHELEWYKEYGYRDSSLEKIISNILRNININGKDLTQFSTDAINSALDDIVTSEPSNNNALDTLITKQKIKKNVSQNNPINNPKLSDLSILLNPKKVESILSDISNLDKFEGNGAVRFRIERYFDNLGLHYDKERLMKKYKNVTNDDIKYLQNVLLNYRKELLGY